MTEVESLLIEYFKLKDRAKHLKAERVAISYEYGVCDAEPGVAYSRCYQVADMPLDEWCESCLRKDKPSKELHLNARRRATLARMLRSRVNKANKWYTYE